ncbi:MAG: hypothetical protein JSW11_08695 [Candidatus Heimdallarchaeota archaeon]|nr:MAG: hypothetical protein JSW11_08695 [Candidatus Heimdallarchaeota archaeon]
MEFIGLNQSQIRDIVKMRSRFPKEEEKLKTINENNVKRALLALSKNERSDSQIKETINWLEKISQFIPIPSEKELEELIQLMILLGKQRSKFNFLYDKLGLELMNRVRECMIRYLIVLSEIRVSRKEFLPHWFTEEAWIFDWSRLLLNLLPTDDMDIYSFSDITAHDFLHLLTLELACADSTSKLEKPMLRMQRVENNRLCEFIIIPTEAAAKEYQIQVTRILNKELTFTEWVNQTLAAYDLPKL